MTQLEAINLLGEMHDGLKWMRGYLVLSHAESKARVTYWHWLEIKDEKQAEKAWNKLSKLADALEAYPKAPHE